MIAIACIQIDADRVNVLDFWQAFRGHFVNIKYSYFIYRVKKSVPLWRKIETHIKQKYCKRPFFERKKNCRYRFIAIFRFILIFTFFSLSLFVCIVFVWIYQWAYVFVYGFVLFWLLFSYFVWLLIFIYLFINSPFYLFTFLLFHFFSFWLCIFLVCLCTIMFLFFLFSPLRCFKIEN